MKWRIQLVYFVTVSAQMAALLAAWQLNMLADDPGPIIIALVVVALGIAGGIVSAFIKRGKYPDNQAIFWLVNILGSTITTAGVFLVFFPVMGLLFHSTVTAITFVFGFLAPLFIPYLFGRTGVLESS